MPPPWNQTSGDPEVPPDVPPEYADAYLAGFRRGLGELEPDPSGERVQQAPQPEPTGPVHESDETSTETETETEAPDASGEPTVAAGPEPEPAQPERPQAPERQRGDTDLEWLFDRRETGPPGWSVRDKEHVEDSTSEPGRKPEPVATASGATSVAGEGPKSRWPLLGAFVVVLLLLMLLAYLGGMAFSTIMNR